MAFLNSNVSSFEDCVEDYTEVDFCRALMGVMEEHWPDTEVVAGGSERYVHIEVSSACHSVL